MVFFETRIIIRSDEVEVGALIGGFNFFKER